MSEYDTILVELIRNRMSIQRKVMNSILFDWHNFQLTNTYGIVISYFSSVMCFLFYGCFGGFLFGDIFLVLFFLWFYAVRKNDRGTCSSSHHPIPLKDAVKTLGNSYTVL